MDRHQLALDCQAVEKSGRSVREYLSGLGFISPWGTWFNLQREELNRKDFQITDGRGERNMTGNPLWDFIVFDQLFNNNSGSSGGSGGDDDENSKWATIITVILFIIIFVCIYAC